MYQNALATAGIEDAEIVVAGPYNISGTAALVGAIKSYENMTGETVSQENVDTATNELVVTGKLAESVGDSDKAEQLVGAVKEQVVEGSDNGKKLTEEERAERAELKIKFKNLSTDLSGAAREKFEDIERRRETND